MSYLLGIDLGTSGLKVSIYTLAGQMQGTVYMRNKYLHTSTGFAEQNPEDWWSACCLAVKKLLVKAKIDAKSISGIGICGFHHCPVFLDKTGRPVRPTIVTHDNRLGDSWRDLQRSKVLPEIIRITGSMVSAGHFPPIYHYVLKNEKETLGKTRWILLAKDYLRYKLTGKIGTEICDATGTHLIVMPEENWSGTLCRLLQVAPEKLPEIGKSGEYFGVVTKEAARAAGLKEGIPVVYGGGDSHCALLGLGVIHSSEVGMLLGTNGTLRASFSGFRKHPRHLVWCQHHVVPGQYTVSASTMAGASVISWFKDMFCAEYSHLAEQALYNKIERLVCRIEPGSNGLFFHPYIYGERTPIYNPAARGSFNGIAHWHTKGHYLRSCMEGVAYCLANCVDLIKEIAGRHHETIRFVRISKAAYRIKSWTQIIAEVMDLPLEIVDVEEAGTMGAALLAGIGAGCFKDTQDAVKRTVRIQSRVKPDGKRTLAYRQQRQTFNKLYALLEPILYLS